jgi:hypothetical protein
MGETLEIAPLTASPMSSTLILLTPDRRTDSQRETALGHNG